MSKVAVLLLHIAGLASSSPHDQYQNKVEMRAAPQHYLPQTGRKLSTAADTPSCMQAAQSGTWGPIRIGYEFVQETDASGNPIQTQAPAAMQAVVMNTFMAKATAYYMATLQVIQAQQPLTVAMVPSGSISQYLFESSPTYSAAKYATCGITTMPAAYHQAQHTATQRCTPGYSCSGACVVKGKCQCDYTAWKQQTTSYCCKMVPGSGCPSTCSASTAMYVGSGTSGGVVCEGGVTDYPQGAGVPNEDHHVLVTISDTGCDGDTMAYSVKCFRDQCDRPLFSQINFCYTKLTTTYTDPTTYLSWISVAVHELTHSLVFSSGLFPLFRNADGSPMFARSATQQDTFVNQQMWSCSNNAFTFPNPNGGSQYLDMSGVLLSASPTGTGQCACPFGTSTMSAGCLPPSDGSFFAMTCKVQLILPTVLQEVRNYFGCPTLTGAELENYDTSACSIVGSHWEQRIFNGELLSPVMGMLPANVSHVSRVTLALFQDSGWYKVNFNMADTLVKGVHWGYQQGCSFATQPCVANGASQWSRGFCTGTFTGDATQNTACAADRMSVVGCDRGSTAAPAATGIYNYFGDGSQGSLPQLDYCPTYTIGITSRSCVTPASYGTLPFSNVNLRREVSNSNSRCLMANLYINTDGTGNGKTYTVAASSVPPAPACYQVNCAADGNSYTVSMAVSSASGTVVTVGTCNSDGQLLTVTGYQGSITCADPAQLCQYVTPAAHLQGAGTAAAATTTTAATTAAATTTTTAAAATTTTAATTAAAAVTTTATAGTTVAGAATTTAAAATTTAAAVTTTATAVTTAAATTAGASPTTQAAPTTTSTRTTGTVTTFTTTVTRPPSRVVGSLTLSSSAASTLVQDKNFAAALVQAIAQMLGVPAAWLQVAVGASSRRLAAPGRLLRGTNMVVNFTVHVPAGQPDSSSSTALVQTLGAAQPSDFANSLSQSVVAAGLNIPLPTVSAISPAQEISLVVMPNTTTNWVLPGTTTTPVPPVTTEAETTVAPTAVPTAVLSGVANWTGSTSSQPGLCLGGLSGEPFMTLLGQQGSTPCSGANGPAEFIVINQVGFGVSTNSSSFLRSDGSMDGNHSRLLQSVNGLMVSLDNQQDYPGATYSIRSSGGFVTSVPTKKSKGWYWTGSSTYFVTSGNISTNTVQLQHQAYSHSTQRLTINTSAVCFAPDSDKTTCGSMSKFNAGTAVYSVYGYSDGVHHNVTACNFTVNNASATSMGFRLLVNLTFMGAGVTTNGITINDGLPLSAGASINVLSLTIRGATTSLILQAPTKYVTGSWLRKEMFPRNLRMRAAPNGADPSMKTFFLDFAVAVENQLSFCQGYFVTQATFQAGGSMTAGGTLVKTSNSVAHAPWLLSLLWILSSQRL